MTATDTPVDNGVNVGALVGVRDALADTPEIAQFQWRASVDWVKGTHSRTSVETFHGFGEQQSHKTVFTHDADHPRSPPRTTASHRWSTCWWRWEAA
jgi:hypothetical protein